MEIIVIRWTQQLVKNICVKLIIPNLQLDSLTAVYNAPYHNVTKSCTQISERETIHWLHELTILVKCWNHSYAHWFCYTEFSLDQICSCYGHIILWHSLSLWSESHGENLGTAKVTCFTKKHYLQTRRMTKLCEEKFRALGINKWHSVCEQWGHT